LAQGQFGRAIIQVRHRKRATTEHREGDGYARQDAAVLCVKAVLQARGPQRKHVLQGFSPAVGKRRSQAQSLQVWASKIRRKHQTIEYTLDGKKSL
jgi:hypothetical protein